MILLKVQSFFKSSSRQQQILLPAASGQRALCCGSPNQSMLLIVKVRIHIVGAYEKNSKTTKCLLTGPRLKKEHHDLFLE